VGVEKGRGLVRWGGTDGRWREGRGEEGKRAGLEIREKMWVLQTREVAEAGVTRGAVAWWDEG